MLKNIIRLCIASGLVLGSSLSFSMEIYTVKPNDYLYRIAHKHSIPSVSASQLTDAIRGINKAEIPGIVDNRIAVGDKLAIPTSKSEVEDGLTLTRNEMMQGYKPSDTSAETDANSSDDKPTTKIESQPVSILVSNQQSSKNISAQSSAIITPVSASHNVAKNDSTDTSLGAFANILKVIIYFLIVVALGYVAKKTWDKRIFKKEEELEILSKKRRDHLMSRISPVVSDVGFYASNESNEDVKQEEFRLFEDSEQNQNNNTEHADQDELSEEEDVLENSEYGNQDKSFAVKTDKGVVFETNTNDSPIITDENIEEDDSFEESDHDLHYIKELIEQYIDSEKYLEASITIQDALIGDQDNRELRYLLLEVYARAGDEIAFDGEVHLIKSKNIISMFDPLHQQIAKLKDKYFE